MKISLATVCAIAAKQLATVVLSLPTCNNVLAACRSDADDFGAPSCKCKEHDLFHFTFDAKTHYGATTFEESGSQKVQHFFNGFKHLCLYNF